MKKTVLHVSQILKANGVSARFEHHTLKITNIPSWRLFKLAYNHRKQLAMIGVAKEVFRAKPKKVEPIRLKDKCPQCAHLNQYYCGWHGEKYKIPTAVWEKGCDKYQHSPTYW